MTAPRLFGVLCIRNEASRYLTECLRWHAPMLDEIFVYDDQSSDTSRDIAQAHHALLEVRPDSVPAFLTHEGDFRQAAWEAFELRCRPDEKDWVLAIDADEFLTCPRSVGARDVLLRLAHELELRGALGCRVKIHEVFDVDDDGVFSVRTDGFWGGITGLRFFQFRPGGRFANRRMGCGSAPTYVQPVESFCSFDLLHLGYASPQDRVDKHNRYYGLPGHNAQHIDSIVSTPALTPWKGPTPW